MDFSERVGHDTKGRFLGIQHTSFSCTIAATRKREGGGEFYVAHRRQSKEKSWQRGRKKGEKESGEEGALGLWGDQLIEKPEIYEQLFCHHNIVFLI